MMVLNQSVAEEVFDTIVAEHDIPGDETVDSTPGGADAEPTAAHYDDEESAEAHAVPDTAHRRRWLRVGIAAVGVALFATTFGLAAALGWQLKQQKDIDAASAAALDVARNYAVILTSVDYAKIDENFTQVLNGATREFKDMYSKSAAQLRQLLIDNKAISHGTVVDAGIKSATKNKVEVLIFVDQSISNAGHPEARIDRSRVTITLEPIDGRWLASKVDIK